MTQMTNTIYLFQLVTFKNYKDIVTGIQSFLSKRKTSIEAEKDTIRVGIIDSGLLSDHPLIKPFLEFSNDFTGEE